MLLLVLTCHLLVRPQIVSFDARKVNPAMRTAVSKLLATKGNSFEPAVSISPVQGSHASSRFCHKTLLKVSSAKAVGVLVQDGQSAFICVSNAA